MNFLNRIPDRIKGIALIIGGGLLLFNVLGVTTEIIRMIVLVGAIAIIVLGIYLANFHTMIYRLFTKKDSNGGPPQS